MSATTCVKAGEESEMKCMLNRTSECMSCAHVDRMNALINENAHMN